MASEKDVRTTDRNEEKMNLASKLLSLILFGKTGRQTPDNQDTKQNGSD